MARQGFCRTGQVAKALGRSPHQVRRLCETGMIAAELGPGKHWRIPVSEVLRLQKDGIPLIPSAVNNPEQEESGSDNKSVAMIKASPRRDWLAVPSRTLMASDQEVQIGRNYSERPKIAKAAEPEADWFPEQNRQRQENQTAQAEAFSNRRATFQAVHAREQWYYRWLEGALESVPWGVPDEYRSEVRQEVDKTLQSLQPQTPDSLTRKLVEGAIQRGLRTWRVVQDTEKALRDALSNLPWSATSPGRPTKWQTWAREEANSAISRLPDGASFESKRASALVAVQKVTMEFEEQNLRQKIIDESIPLPLFGSTEKEDARAAIRASVESSRPGSTELELRRARQAALRPFEDRYRERENRQRLERKVDQGLHHIRTTLNRWWNDGELEGFENDVEVWNYANEIRERVRAGLLKNLKDEQEINDHRIRGLIEALLDDLLLD